MIKIRFRSESGELLSEQKVENFPAIVGRDDGSDIVLNESGISGRHAEIDCDGYWLTVRDLGSRNGTFVGKEQINSTKLKLPCAVVLGGVITMEVEGALERSAIAVRATMTPKTLKRPESPHVPMPVMPEPVPAMTVVVDDAEIIEGWELYWHMLKKLSPRPILIAMMALSAFYSFLHFVVFRENFFFSLGAGMGNALLCVIASAALAVLLAVPGILFRGSFDFKPLFVCFSLCTMLLTAQNSILRPASLMEYFGYVAQALSLPLIVVTSLPMVYVILFNTFSHKHAKKLMIITLVLAGLGILGEAREVLSIDRQALMREALMGEFRTARGLAGGTSDVKGVTDDIREFGRGLK